MIMKFSIVADIVGPPKLLINFERDLLNVTYLTEPRNALEHSV